MKGGCLSECIGIKGEGAVEMEATKKEVPGNKEQKWANSRSVEIKRRDEKCGGERDWKEKKESRAREVEKDDRGCPLWSPEDIRGLIEFTSSLVGPADVGRAYGRSVFGPDSAYVAISMRSFPPRSSSPFYGGDNRKFHDYTTNSRKLRCRIRDRDIWYDTRCSLLLRSFVLSRWWTLDGRVFSCRKTRYFAPRQFLFLFDTPRWFCGKKI